jgi:hypothetical protein
MSAAFDVLRRRVPIFALTALLAPLVATISGTSPTQAQFVCEGIAGAGAGGAGADAATSGANLACGANANAVGAASGNVAVGAAADANGSFSSNTATGLLANASGGSSNNIAIGNSANAAGNSSGNIAQGAGSFADGNNSRNTAVGDQASARGNTSFNVAVGNGANASGDNMSNTAVGNGAIATGANSAAFGAGAQATAANSAAFGNGAVATRANQQAFGTAANTYTMAGVASAASRTAQGAPTHFVMSNSSGDLAAFTPAELGLATAGDLNAINARLNDIGGMTDKALTGVAMAFAMAGVPNLMPHEKFAIAVNYGTFQGRHGVAFNSALKLHDNVQFTAGVGYGANERLVGGRAGLRFGW